MRSAERNVNVHSVNSRRHHRRPCPRQRLARHLPQLPRKLSNPGKAVLNVALVARSRPLLNVRIRRSVLQVQRCRENVPRAHASAALLAPIMIVAGGTVPRRHNNPRPPHRRLSSPGKDVLNVGHAVLSRPPLNARMLLNGLLVPWRRESVLRLHPSAGELARRAIAPLKSAQAVLNGKSVPGAVQDVLKQQQEIAVRLNARQTVRSHVRVHHVKKEAAVPSELNVHKVAASAAKGLESVEVVVVVRAPEGSAVNLLAFASVRKRLHLLLV